MMEFISHGSCFRPSGYIQSLVSLIIASCLLYYSVQGYREMKFFSPYVTTASSGKGEINRLLFIQKYEQHTIIIHQELERLFSQLN